MPAVFRGLQALPFETVFPAKFSTVFKDTLSYVR